MKNEPVTKNTPVRRYIRPGYLLVTGAVIALLMIAAATLQISQGKRTIRGLMDEKAAAVIQQLEAGTSLAVRAGEETESEIALRLLSAARTAVLLDAQGNVAPRTLSDLAQSHRIDSLILLDENGRVVASDQGEQARQGGFADLFSEILRGESPEAVIGPHDAPGGDKVLFSAGVRRAGGGAAVASVDQQELTALRRSFGFGRLIQDARSLSGLKYLIIQDPDGFIAATENIREASAIEGDPFLAGAWESGETVSRLAPRGDEAVFEAARRIALGEGDFALLRVAFDAEQLREIESKARQRLIVTVVGLAFLLVVAVNALIIYQNMNLVRRARDEATTFSGAILRGIADAIVVTAPDGSVPMANDRAKSLFGPRIDRLPHQLEGLIERAGNSREPVIEEMSLKDGAGEPVEILVGVSLVTIPGDENPHAVFILRDVTRMRRMERHLTQSEKVAEMGRLAGAVAHEVRNPLNAIGMTTQRLRSEFSPTADREEYDALLRIVTEEIERLDGIITQFLRFARAPQVEIARGDLAELVRSAVSETSGLASAKSIRMRVDAPERLAADFDAKQIRQVLLNLLANAFEACPEGGEVRLSLEDRVRDAVISIRDDGVGMDEGTRSRLFDLYFTTKDRGTGLGMPIAQTIVQAHGGGIDVSSAPGEGSTVTVRLPKGG